MPEQTAHRRLVVPDGQRDNVVAEIHGAAHIGAEATIRVARALFWWPQMDAEIRRAVVGCATCQRINASRKRAPGNLGDVERERVPLRCAEWEVDTFHVGGMLGGGLAFSAVERFSGLVLSKVVPSSSAMDALDAFTDLVLRPFGVPRRLFSDNGSEFQGAFALELRRLGVEHITGLPDNHNAVARVERHNRDRNNRLAQMLLRNNQQPPATRQALQRWIDMADTAANTVPTSSGYSPHELLFGQRRLSSVMALVPDDMLLAISGINSDEARDIVSRVRLHRAVLAVLDEARQEARARDRAAIERAHSRGHAAPLIWQQGDLVLARIPRPLRDGEDKANARLEFSGVWQVQSHDTNTERVVLKLAMPMPGADNGDFTPVDSASTITVHARDVRSYVDAVALDSTHQISPLHVGFAPPALDAPWLEPFTASDARANEAHRLQASTMRSAVKRLLTLDQERRESASIEQAIRAMSEQQAAVRAPAAPTPLGGGEAAHVQLPTTSSSTTVQSSTLPQSKKRAVSRPTTSATSVVPASGRVLRSSNRSAARNRQFNTGDNVSEFVEITGISDDRCIVYGHVDSVDGQRTDGLVEISRYVDCLCPSDAALLERWSGARGE